MQRDFACPPDAKPSELALVAADPPLEVFRGAVADNVFFQIVKTNPEARVRPDLPHAPYARTVISVVECLLVKAYDDKSQALVSIDLGSHRQVDVRALVEDFDMVAKTCFRWSVMGKAATMRARPSPFEVDTDSYQLVPEVGIEPHEASSSSSSSAVVPVAPPGRDAEVAALLHDLVKRQAFSVGGGGPIKVSALLAKHPKDLLPQVLSAGVLVQTVAPSGEDMVHLNMPAVSWSVNIGLAEPVQHIRVAPHMPPLKTHKLQLVMQLHMEGWSPKPKLTDDFSLGGDLVYRSGFQQPASYFAALLQSEAVFGKGVPQIIHGRTDGYYKCLLLLKTGALNPILADIATRDDAWLKQQLKDSRCPEDGGDGQDEDESEADPDLPALADLPASLVGGDTLVVEQVAQVSFTRVIVDTGVGSEQLKIYFDNFTGGGREQRGFCNCEKHGCIKYRTVGGESKERFCAWMYLWHSSRATPLTKAKRLALNVGDAEVDRAVRRLRMTPF